MTRGRRRIVRTGFGIVCLLLGVALVALWWRSRTTVDLVAWTTDKLDPSIAATDLPVFWRRPFIGAAKTFSISSDDGFIRLASTVYLGHEIAITPPPIVVLRSIPAHKSPEFEPPHPFPQEPGWRVGYCAQPHATTQPFRLQGFQTHGVAAQTSQPRRDWTYQNRVISIPFWAPIIILWIPTIILVCRHMQARRLARIGLCQTCGYDLRASPDRCPECGAAVTAVASPAGH